jgi:histone acetyltransferase (RNA polymerase elongator complex component)
LFDMKFAIFPVFLSGYPCDGRCIYCNAALATDNEKPPDADAVRSDIEQWLTFPSEGKFRQIALYGNDLFSLSGDRIHPILSICLDYLYAAKVDGLRTSLRPDTVLATDPVYLKQFSVIELGMPSIDDRVLRTIQRGHDAEMAVRALNRLKTMHIDTGCQTMIGLPGATHESDILTARRIAGLKPDFVRIHPTLVLKNTELETMYRSGLYQPLTLEDAVERCADICDIYHKAGIPVTRCGFHLPESVRRKAWCAGPWHPAFGQHVKSRLWRRYFHRQYRIHPDKLVYYVSERDYSDAVGQKCENLNWLRHHCHRDFDLCCNK